MFLSWLLLPRSHALFFGVSRGIPSQTRSQVWDAHWPPRLPHNITHWTSPTKGRMNVSKSTCKPPGAWCTSKIARVLSSACVRRESPRWLTCTQPSGRHVALSTFCANTLAHSNGKYSRPSVVLCDVISIGVVMSWVPAVGGKVFHDIRDPFSCVSFKHPLYYKDIAKDKSLLWCLKIRMVEEKP